MSTNDMETLNSLAGIRRAIGDVLAALVDEAQALGAGDTARLEELVAHKRSALDVLERSAPDDGLPLPDDLVSALAHCRELNELNGQSIAVRLTATRGTLTRLTRLVGIHSVSLYDGTGRMQSSYSGRDLGQG